MKTLRYILAMGVVMVVAGTAHSQIVTDMAIKNTKIPKGEHPSVAEDKLSRQKMDVQLDSAATYYTLIDSAQVRIARKDWAGAEDFIRKAIANEPTNNTNSMLLSNLGTLQRYQGKLQDAIKNYTLALDMTPNAVTLLLNRAATYMESGDVEKAVADFEKVRSLDETEEESRYTLGVMAMDNGDMATAEELFREIKQFNDDSELANEGLGMMYKQKGDYGHAVVYLSEAIKKDPNPTLLGNRADCYLILKQLNSASLDIQNALEKAPDDGFLYLLRAKLNKMRFNKDDMKRDIELAVKYGVDKELAEQIGE